MKQNRIIDVGLEEEAAQLRSQGISIRKMSEKLSELAGEKIAPSTVWRYFNDNKDPVRQAVARRVETVERSISHRLDVVEQLREINDVARSILLSTISTGEYTVAMKAMKRIQEQLELQARLLGDIVGDSVVIVVKWDEPYEDKNRDNTIQTIPETA